jgi:hypothetical protein
MGVGGWDRIGSGFVDEGFDWLRDGRHTPPAVRLKMSALGNRWLAVIDPLVTRDDKIRIHPLVRMFAKFLCMSVFVKILSTWENNDEP